MPPTLPSNEHVIQAIFGAINEVNEQLPKEKKIETSTDTPLFGRLGVLDSLGLVNLIVAVEQRFEEHLGVEITLADEEVMFQQNSPFQSIGTLVDYVTMLLGGKVHEQG